MRKQGVEMIFKRSTVTSLAAIAATIAVMSAATPADAKDWKRAMDRHDAAAKLSKYTPRGGNPQWDFDLQTVVNDMQWRQRTAQRLRSLRRPGVERQQREPSQLADREAPARLRFSF